MRPRAVRLCHQRVLERPGRGGASQHETEVDTQWTGHVYSHDSGDTYYGTMDLKGANRLRVEACALGRFYCSGNNWSRITGRAERLMSSRQTLAEPRS